MKFLAAFILSLSLLVSSSFAVSLTPPLVLKMQEDRTVSASDFAAEEAKTDFSPFRYFVGELSPCIGFIGILLTITGCTRINYEEYNRTDCKIAIGAGIGMMVLGGLGLYWAF